MKYMKKPVVIEAITFDQLVEYGKAHTTNIVNGMPWSFDYAGQPVTHENDECYLIPTLEGTMKMGPGDMLITGVKGEIYPCKLEIFELSYLPMPAVNPLLQPHQQRVVDEQMDLDDKRLKLGQFIGQNPIYRDLPQQEQSRLNRQLEAMTLYSNILGERIAAFA